MHKIEKLLIFLQEYEPKLRSINYGKKNTYEFSINIVVDHKHKEIMNIIEKYNGLDKTKFFEEFLK